MPTSDQCVDHGATVVKCAVCGKDVHTCERDVAIGNDYRCPAHPYGCQLSDGRWVCSERCWDTAANWVVTKGME